MSIYYCFDIGAQRRTNGSAAVIARASVTWSEKRGATSLHAVRTLRVKCVARGEFFRYALSHSRSTRTHALPGVFHIAIILHDVARNFIPIAKLERTRFAHLVTGCLFASDQRLIDGECEREWILAQSYYANDDYAKHDDSVKSLHP